MTFTPAEVRRVARLAHLEIEAAEEVALARDLDAIAAEFADLARHADALPDAPAPDALPPREDALAPSPRAEADAILDAAPRKEGRLVRGRRGPV